MEGSADQKVNLLPFDGEVYFFPKFFEEKECRYFFERLQEEIQWKQESIRLFGREMLQPRLTAWYGDAGRSYSYSGITLQPRDWTTALLQIKSRIEAVAQVRFNSALLNLYRHGKDSMGWHRDNERSLGQNPVIGSVSFGETRTFRLRYYKPKDMIKTIQLNNGSFLLMKGATQHFWEHQVPKTTRKVNERINITFRIIK